MGEGSLVMPLETLPLLHVFNSFNTSLILILLPLPSVATTADCWLLFPSNALRAVGAHSFERDHGICNRFESPLINMLLRPTNTKSCGNDFSAFTGEFGDSSPLSYPPGRVSTLPSNSHMATAAGPSAGASSASSTPSSNARFPIFSRSAGFTSLSRSSSASMTFDSVSRARPPICFTWPKSIRPILPSSRTNIFPGCGSAWKNPVSKIHLPKTSVKLLNSFLPNNCASGLSGLIPFLAISSAARLSGTPSK
mmetsp:Transcript_12514/g.27061  ORF Transcript_12514/g.27061 Transcript_12514/m.27061 type:complete len:252 (+) Transcript_12514:156-911(+)